MPKQAIPKRQKDVGVVSLSITLAKVTGIISHYDFKWIL